MRSDDDSRPEAGPASADSHKERSKARASDTRVVAKGGAVQVGGQIANRALTFLFVAVGVRVLGPQGYGLYKQVFQVLTVGTMLASGGFPWAAVRFIAQARARNDPAASRGAGRATIVVTALVAVAFLAATLVAARAIAAPFADSLGDREQFATLLRIGAAYIPLYAIMQTLRSCTQAYKTMVPAVMVGNIIQPISRLALGIGALLLGFALTGAVTTLVISAGLGTAAGLWYYRRILTADERAARPRAEMRPILKFSLLQAGVSFFGTGSLGLGILLLGLLASDRQVGLFAIATSLQTAGNVFVTGVVSIFSPVVVELYEKAEIGRIQSLYQTINRWLATLSFPIFAALMIESDFFVRLLAGNAAGGAAVLVPVLAVGNAFKVATGPSSYLLSMTGRPLLNFFNSLLAVGLYVGLGFIVVPAYGAMGMAVVDTGVTLLVNLARVIEAWALMGIKPFGRSFLKPVVAVLMASAALMLWGLWTNGSTITILLGLALLGAVYVAALKVMGLDPEEREVFETIKARRFKRPRRSKSK